MNRRKFLLTAAASGTIVLPGCGGGEDFVNLASAPTGTTPPSLPPPSLPPPSLPPPSLPPPSLPPAPAPATVTSASGAPPPPPQPAWPTSRPAEVSVEAYENNIGVASPESPFAIYWQSAFTTKDGTLIEWGTGDHGLLSDNGVREFDPATGVQTYVYPNNNGTKDNQQYDNLHYLYIPRIDALVISGGAWYDRGSGTWLTGNLLNTGRSVIGTGPNDLFNPIVPFWTLGFGASYNPHQAWSADLDCGVCIAGGHGGDRTARQKLWIIAPSSGFGSYAQPYVIYERIMPATAGGAAAHKINGRDGCCFADEYVYWVGGEESNSETKTPHFFRMRITPHLTSTSATLAIERLPDAPAAFHMGLLRYDPHSKALLCIGSEGVFVFDIAAWSWADITPQGYRNDYAAAPSNGLLPRGCMGDFVEQRSGRTMRKIVWRPGFNHSWGFDYGGANSERMYKRFRAIKLVRRV